MIRYQIYNIGTALSVLINALTGGHAPETLCCRAARARRNGSRWGRGFCAIIDKFDPGHCERSLHWWES